MASATLPYSFDAKRVAADINNLSAQQLPLTPPSEPTHMSNDDAISSNGSTTAPEHKHIWVITGPAGCGKTSVAEYLHQTFELPYLEGDVYHPPANVEKMASNIPLTDADRWDWLILLREEALSTLRRPLPASPTTTSNPAVPAAPTNPADSNTTPSGVIVTCSALKRKYRDVMRLASYNDPAIKVHFIFLQATEALLLDRVRMRKGHYMKDSMVRSQFQSLEAPQGDEQDVLAVDASGEAEGVLRLAGGVMRKVLSEDA